MAIARMQKVLIVSHRGEAGGLLEALQADGICQILNAEEAMVSKQWPELGTGAERPKIIEEKLARLTKSISFLKKYSRPAGGLAAMLAPRAVIDQKTYSEVICDESLFEVSAQCLELSERIEKINTEAENINGVLNELEPWRSLETEVEQIGQLEQTTCLAGLIARQKFDEVCGQLSEVAAAVQRVACTGERFPCLIVCLNDDLGEVQKLLRAADFETVNFEPMTGTAAELIAEHREKLVQAENELESLRLKAEAFAENLLKLKILCDHYSNLLNREQSRSAAPATEHTILLEGWVRKKDFARLEKLVAGFGASSLSKIEPGEDEEIPVEIENKNIIKPFESITRLYGMPDPLNVDPTVFLAPFFAIFFGLCLTDAGYGIVLAAVLWYFIKKVQGDKKMLWMFFVCSILSIAGGVITGGWFGDSIQSFLPQADGFRKKLMLFDPMEKPMVFFAISLSLGYIQIMFGLFIAFFHNLKQKNITAAICDQVTWIVMLNSLILFGLTKGGIVWQSLSPVFVVSSLVPAITILLFSERQGSWGGRIGMGVFNLFCTVFYVGDVLSYVRIMALGMVTGGFGLAVNILTKLVADVPYVGWFLGLLVFVGMHLFNLAISVLGSFVHSMRLQFVEFFPKFFVGGGRQFQPLSREYKYIHFN